MKGNDGNSYGHILKYTSLFGSVQGLGILVSIVRNKLVALLLGPGGMGLVALFNSVVSFISQSTGLGISTSAVKNISEAFERGDEAALGRQIATVRVWCMLTGLVGMLVCMVLGPVIDCTTFTWGDHSLHFFLLSPIVLLTAVAGGEAAVLKGTRRLKSLAASQVAVMTASLAITVPIYYFFGESGIVPVLVLVALVQLVSLVVFSYRHHPLSLGGMSSLVDGLPMVRLGVAFMLSGVVGSGAELLVRTYLNRVADLSTVGLYNAGYMLTFTYAGMIFTAMDTDYYPRLSAINKSARQMMLLANRQMDVSILLVAPILVAAIALLPVLVPLLLSSSFLPIVPMTQVAALSMFFKAITLPIAYIPLARGDSKTFMALETSYFVVFVVLVVLGFDRWGLVGAGIAIFLAHVFDFAIEYATARFRYGFHMSGVLAVRFVVLFLLGVASYAVSLSSLPLLPTIVAESIIFALSLSFFIHKFRKYGMLEG